VIIKVISLKSRKKITTIFGLFDESKNGLLPYFGEEVHKKIVSKIRKKCAAGAIYNRIKKIIQIQGYNTTIIVNYFIELGIPVEKIYVN